MSQVKPIPEGMRTITPHLICDGAAQAIEFYKKAFNAVEHARMPDPSGKIMHAHLSIGDSALMLVDEYPQMGARGPKALNGTPVTIHLYVDNVDATFAQAIAAGATVKMPVADMFWGDRYGMLEDPFGHNWSIATHIKDVTPDDMRAAMRGAPKDCA